MIRVTVWNEFRHEKSSKEVAAIYPNGLHATIAEFLGKNEDIECRLACLDDPEHGLTDDVLDNTDVLIWWGHMAHDQVSDAVVDKVQDHGSDRPAFRSFFQDLQKTDGNQLQFKMA